MATRGQDIVSLIKRQIEEFGGDLALVDVGTVVQVGDGVASIQGLQGVRSNELLDFGDDVLGLALNLESDIVGAAILGDPNAVKEGQRVRSTGRIIEVPVGEALIGRVVDPLGRPLDGKGSMQADLEAGRPLELEAIVGSISRIGRKMGMATPLIDVLYALLLPYKNGHPRDA